MTKNTMAKYEVMLYPKAYRDIDDIYAYIALEKQSPENAKGQTDRIWDAIESLEINPHAHQDRLVGGYAGKGSAVLRDNGDRGGCHSACYDCISLFSEVFY